MHKQFTAGTTKEIIIPQQKYLCIQYSARRENLIPEEKIVSSEWTTDGLCGDAKKIIDCFLIISVELIVETMTIARECSGVILPGLSVEICEIQTASLYFISM
ncbi:MAG: hypothetical protein WCW35_10535 [Bacteroidota bacterium]